MSEPTYALEVEGIGAFTFRRRNRIRNQLAIEAQYGAITGGLDHIGPILRGAANAYAGLKVLTVEGPKGWNLEALDLMDEADGAKLLSVWQALLEKEAFFRSGRAPDGAQGG